MRWFIDDRVVNLVLLINAAALFALAIFPPHSPVHIILQQVDVACVAYFIFEVGLKIRRDGTKTYLSTGWNRFDFAVTIASLPVLISPFVALSGWEAVVLLRLARLFRLFRMMRFVPDVDRLAHGLGRAVKAAFGIVIALALANGILGLGATVLFGQFAPEHFGDPFAAMYSLFRVFTMDGWSELPDLIAERSGSVAWGIFARAYFVSAVIGGGMLGMGLANAVLVDEMLADDNRDLLSALDELRGEVRALRAEIQQDRAELQSNGDGDGEIEHNDSP